MPRLSLSCDPAVLLVADTSVIINLCASGYSEPILDALPNRVVVVKEVFDEVRDDRRNGRNDSEALDTLIATGRVQVRQLGPPAQEWFELLVTGAAADTLDDGEAATISFAAETKAAALIDEAKASRISMTRFPTIRLGNSLDLIRHPAIQERLSRYELSEAVFHALQFGRMRVPSQHLDWVVQLIGAERASQCHSLPRSVRTFLQV